MQSKNAPRSLSSLWLPFLLWAGWSSCAATAPAAGGGAGAEDGEESAEEADHELALAKMALILAEESAAGAKSEAELELRMAERGVAEAERDLQHFTIESELRLEAAQLDLDRATGRMQDAQLELLELEAMYAEEDFAEKTKELVLTRGRRQLEHSKRSLDIARREQASLAEHELPQEQRELEAALLQARGDLESAQRGLRVAQVEAKRDLMEAKRELSELTEDDA